jgi:hypothetical protein
MNDFQEQAKNWLRNVVKQNPDKIKAGVEKAGDLIDKQTGGKYADKVNAVQEKVDGYVDSQASDAPATPGTSEAPDSAPGETSARNQPADSGETAGTDEVNPLDEPTSSSTSDEPTGESTSDESGAGQGGVIGGQAPDVAGQPSSSAGSGAEGARTGGTATGTTEGGLPGPRSAE